MNTADGEFVFLQLYFIGFKKCRRKTADSHGSVKIRLFQNCEEPVELFDVVGIVKQNGFFEGFISALQVIGI